jgi:peptide/nickel transport system substrate-binding protein
MNDQSDGRDGGLSRRQFVKGAAALGLAVPGVASVLESTARAQTIRVGDEAASAAKRGGVIRLGLSDNFADFDPHHEPFGNFPFINQIYGAPLLDQNQPNPHDAIKWLATGIKFGPRFAYVDVTLRPGVKFHDGTPLNADAMIANLKKVRDKVGGRDQYPAWDPIVKRVQKINPMTTRIFFKKPVANEYMIELLSRLNLISPTLIAKGQKALLTQASGTGAFQLASYRQGNKAVLNRNPDFWKKPLPYVDRVEFNFFTDPNAMTNALQSGGLDMVATLPPQFVPSLKNRFDIVSGPAGTTFEVIVSAKPGRPFERKEARQALQSLVNRKRFAEEIMFGTGSPAFVHVDHASIGWKPEFDKRYAYDPDLAKKRFEALGMLGQKPIEIVQLQGVLPLIGRLAEMVAGDMNAIGLSAKLTPVDISVWGERFYASDAGNYDMITSFMGRSNRYPTFPAVGNIGLNPISNPAWPNNKPPAKYTEGFLKLQTAQSPAEQKKWALQMQESVLDESWDIAVAYQHTQYAMAKKLKNFKIGRDDWMILDEMYYT